MARPRLHGILLRTWRLGVLVAIAWLIHQQHAWFVAQRDATLTADRVKDFFPEATHLGPRDPATGVQRVLDANENPLGLVTQTTPLSDPIIGYSGPTNTLVALDNQSKVIGLRVLRSDDTPDHLTTVLRKRSFFDTFKGLKLGDTQSLPQVDAVSGATLTSTAIAQGVLARLGRQGPSMRFPQEITLEEVKELQPDAATMIEVKNRPGLFALKNAAGDVIAHATRTAPFSDSVVGYKGPSDTLLLLDRAGTKITKFRLRKSFDTKEYVGYVTENDFFHHVFDDMEIDKAAGLDFNAAGIEGVSGATDTSWAMAEGIKRRAGGLVASRESSRAWYETFVMKPVDWGMLGVLALSLCMAFTSLRGKRWARWMHQAALIGYAGFYGGLMISQGLLSGWARHGIPWQTAPVLVLLTALALMLPLLTRRQFYCHHYCPHGALQQWLFHRIKWQIRLPHKLMKSLEKLPVVLLLVILVIVMLGLTVNINAMEAFDAWLFRIAGWGTLVVAITGLVFSMFNSMAYCRYGCPTGALLKFVRYAGDADRFGRKDAVALALVAIAGLIHWQREPLSAWLSSMS